MAVIGQSPPVRHSVNDIHQLCRNIEVIPIRKMYLLVPIKFFFYSFYDY